MKVDLVYSQPHYLDHLLPIWNALPDGLLGEVHRRNDMYVDRDRVALVAGGVDAHVLRDQCKAVYVEHGAGQTYGGASLAEAQNPSYSGAGSGRWPHVIGYIAPSDKVAARWAPVPAAAVGCPKMDRYINDRRTPLRSVCFTFHWDATFCPEARWTFGFWGGRLDEIVSSFKAQGYRVFGHQHPRWGEALSPRMERAGMTMLQRDQDVFTEAEILFVDNSSLGPEFAALGRPVCWLNGPDYRRDVEHGQRFWDWSKLAPTFDSPRQLLELDLDSIERPVGPHPLALDAYKYIDGRSSQRAAMFVAELIRAL